MNSFKGTWTLVRLALRRDRIKLSLWIVAIAGMLAANIPAVIDFYGGSFEKQVTYASTTAPSVVSRVFGGPIKGPIIGEIVMNEVFLFTAIAVAFMSTLAVIRHTRQEEETGRAEIIRSAIVGGSSNLTAALIIAVGANLVLGALTALIFLSNDLPTSGSIAVGAALAGVGIAFAAFAAIAAQLSESARGANGLSAMVIGVAFLIRAVGDGIGDVVSNGLGVASNWLSWLSPFGWGQQMYAFSDSKWWVLGLFPVLFAGLIAAAYALNAHRDVGLGMLPAKPGPARASKRLLSAFGLSWRLQRGVLRGWAVGIAVMGIIIGVISKEFENLFSTNEEIAEYFKELGGEGSISDILFTGMLMFMAIAIGGYVVQALLRIRSEESRGYLEPVISTGVSRAKWLFSHVLVVGLGIVMLTLLLGITAGSSFVLITDATGREVISLTIAAMSYVPAIFVLAGFVVFIFGALPKKAVALAWVAFAICFFIVQFASVLKLPQWVLNVSPFTHSPAAPIADITVRPLLLLSLTAIVLMAAGMLLFRHRDITTD